MKIEEIEVPSFEKIIRAAWEADESLVNEWHIKAGEGLESCVKDTLDVLSNDVDKTTFHLYAVKDGDKEIGFFGKELVDEKPFLTTFYIYPDYRTKDCKEEFLKLIFSELGDEFVTAVYAKNTRALNWFIRNGADFLGEVNNENGSIVLMKLKL